VTERPEDEQRDEEPVADGQPEPAAEEQPEPAAEEQPEPVGEAEPTPEEPAREEPTSEEPAREEPTSEEPAREEPTSEEPAATPDEGEVVVEARQSPVEDEELVEDDDELEELAPRQKPEIPGADLIPDIVPEGEQFLDAEAQAAAEAEAEAQAAREREQADEEESRPIADAAIDLAAGARYTATGKRKTAVARVLLRPGTGAYTINGKTLDAFFPRETLRRIIRQPLETVGYESRMDVIARMHGGGVSAQAGALRHGISRALIVADPNLRGELKRRGFLTRDPRVKERKKAGLKKARKRPQFSKR
jgi:small subunit ribosomal protein S9